MSRELFIHLSAPPPLRPDEQWSAVPVVKRICMLSVFQCACLCVFAYMQYSVCILHEHSADCYVLQVIVHHPPPVWCVSVCIWRCTHLVAVYWLWSHWVSLGREPLFVRQWTIWRRYVQPQASFRTTYRQLFHKTLMNDNDSLQWVSGSFWPHTLGKRWRLLLFFLQVMCEGHVLCIQL